MEARQNSQQVVDFNKQPFLRDDRKLQVTPVFFIMTIHKPFLNRVIFILDSKFKAPWRWFLDWQFLELVQ